MIKNVIFRAVHGYIGSGQIAVRMRSLFLFLVVAVQRFDNSIVNIMPF